MINVIIGENASGKTKKLMAMYNRDITTATINLDDADALRDIPLCREDIEFFEEMLGLKNIVIRENQITVADITETFGRLIPCSSEFLNILSVVCKQVEKVYLDEPEYYLSNTELNYLIYCLQEFDKEVWITSHYKGFILNYSFRHYKIGNNDELEIIEVDDLDEYIDEI